MDRSKLKKRRSQAQLSGERGEREVGWRGGRGPTTAREMSTTMSKSSRPNHTAINLPIRVSILLDTQQEEQERAGKEQKLCSVAEQNGHTNMCANTQPTAGATLEFSQHCKFENFAERVVQSTPPQSCKPCCANAATSVTELHHATVESSACLPPPVLSTPMLLDTVNVGCCTNVALVTARSFRAVTASLRRPSETSCVLTWY